MKRLLIKISVIIFSVSMLCASAHAKISRQTVSKAWHTLTQAEGLGNLPIHYESDDGPNAWVMFQEDGNFSLHVTSGLLNILNTEAEIAGVLGHEIGHVKLGHYYSMVLDDTARTILSANLERTDDLSQAAGKIDMDLRESLLSREDETAADDYGVSLLKRTGYNSLGLYNAMKRFGDNGYSTERNGLNSHPASAERLAHLAEISGTDKHMPYNNEIDDIASAIMGR